jgi:hypothetical protein
MRRALTLFVPIALFISAACGGSPTFPSGGTATITGTVVGSAGGSSSTAGSSSAGTSVSVVGGSANSTVDMNGRFTLTGVRAGDNIELRFRGQGFDVRVTIGQIEGSEDVTITIVRNGQTFVLDRLRRHGRDKEELEGRIDGLPPTTAAGTFTIAGQNVQTDADTKIVKGGAPATFADLQIGMRVHVRGTPNANGVLAKLIIIQNVNVDLGFELEGTISAFTGTASDFNFIVDGRLVKGDATTEFDDITFAQLANGVRVEVKGEIRIGFIFARKIEAN